MVDRDGTVLLHNKGSGDFLGQCEVLRIDESRLTALSNRENSALRRAMAGAANPQSYAGDRAATVVTIDGLVAAHPTMISVRPAGKLFCSDTRRYRHVAIVSAKNPEKYEPSQVCAFSKLYQLTPAQARLTGLILSGHSRAKAAKHLKVSENTVRSHLKQIFLKTNTHGQMDLVQLHAKICTDHF